MVKGTAAVSARARAREAKAVLDARRAEQDRLVVDAATNFYEGAAALEVAQAAAAAAEQRRVAAVGVLAGLGQTDEQIGVLCGLDVKDVRDLRRVAASVEASGPDKAAEAPAGDKPAEAPADDQTRTDAAA